MKFTNIMTSTFNTGRNILRGTEFLDNLEFGKNLLVKSVEDKETEFKFDAPLKIGDVKKLFDMQIDTEIFNPIYIGENLALDIKNNDFLPLIKGTKDLVNQFLKEINKMKAQVIDNSILIPQEFSEDNLIIKTAIEKIQDMIENTKNQIPLVKFVTEINDYKDKLKETIEVSEKAIDILNGNTLLNKDVFNMTPEAENYFIAKRNEVINNSKKIIEDIEILTKNLTDVTNVIQKTADFKNMFELSEQDINDEVSKDLEQQKMFSNTFH